MGYYFSVKNNIYKTETFFRDLPLESFYGKENFEREVLKA